ncbi:hypothetical protein GCM10017673_40240 [Streptosporangium violaceochromogenes]|nr:hypothetical protein GCM10017673_40240 [Streptosporangium violaceochromogenes]
MTQLTYYPPPDRHDGLRWGYTLNDLDHITRMALARHIAGRNIIRAADRYHLAWSGVAEALYAADTPPDRADLIAAGHRALIEAREEELQAHGWSIDTGHLQTRPRFAAYWAPVGDGGFADAIIDRLGLHTALQTLTPRQRDAVHAVATLGTYDAAQQHLGIGRGTLTSHLHAARLAILQAWMPGETPIPPRYVHSRAPIRCGTPHGYRTHSKRREKPCEACRAASRQGAPR